jgi:hypothetical protein
LSIERKIFSKIKSQDLNLRAQLVVVQCEAHLHSQQLMKMRKRSSNIKVPENRMEKEKLRLLLELFEVRRKVMTCKAF